MRKPHRVIDWIEANLLFPSKAGPKLYRKPFKLLNWQKDILWEVFDENGNLIKTKLFISSCRKTGKSCFAGAIVNYLMYGKNSTGFECPVVASSFNQGKFVFSLLSEMAELSFKPYTKARKESVTNEKTKATSYIACSLASTNQGSQPSALLVDELACHQDSENIDTFEAGLMLADPEPLIIYLTNPSEDLTHFSVNYLKKARREQKKKNSNWCVRIFQAPVEDDITKKSTWLKANPTLRESKLVNINWYKEKSEEAKESVEAMYSFRRFFLGQWHSGNESHWIDTRNWKVLEKDNKKLGVLSFGLDLSFNRDLSSLVAIEELKDGYFIHSKFYLPEVGLESKRPGKKKRFIKYEKEGWLRIQNTKCINEDEIFSDFQDMKKKSQDILDFNIDMGSGAYRFAKNVESVGIPCQLTKMVASQMAPLINFMTKLDRSEKIYYDGSPLLKECFTNTILTSKNSRGYRSVDRLNKEDSIDGSVASLLASKSFMECEERPKMDVYYG